MKQRTRANIYYDLTASPHYHIVEYPDTTIKYVFSSELYRNNFISRLNKNRESINSSLTNRFGFSVKVDKIADLKLYTSIEKRGFYLLENEVSITCLQELMIDGSKMIVQI